MKLPSGAIDLRESLDEFDIWITASLGEVRDTDRFRQELDRIAYVFDALGLATSDFATVASCKPDSIAATFVGIVDKMAETAARDALNALASVLFLVTGRSDNNAKCQLPLHLRDVARWSSIPAVIVERGKGTRTLANVPIPRELKADRVMGIVAGLRQHPEPQTKLLREFVRFVLSDDGYVSQLWSIGRSYFALKSVKKERDLLSPLVVFQVRGSVAASGGHDPEDLLRGRLDEWGLLRDVDYNVADAVLTADVVPVEGEDAKRVKSKTRAYDFILPYCTPGWTPRVFIQCQFYAGDSGSVSHKNVDQTTTSRASVAEVIPEAIFVEYVDGAGYFSSLNGDLKSLLSMASTQSFFQLRTAAIRLRRELQQIGFLVPLELEHAVLRTDGRLEDVHKALMDEGYTDAETTRAIDSVLGRGLLHRDSAGALSLVPTRRDTVRRYFLLDTAAIHGTNLGQKDNLSGLVLVPGYGPFHGLPLDELATKAVALAPALVRDWSSPEVILRDLRWLREQGMIIVG